MQGNQYPHFSWALSPCFLKSLPSGHSITNQTPLSLSKGSSSPHPARYCFSFLLSLTLTVPSKSRRSYAHFCLTWALWTSPVMLQKRHGDGNCLTGDNAGTGRHILLQPLTQPLNWHTGSFWNILPLTKERERCVKTDSFPCCTLCIFLILQKATSSSIHGLDVFQSYK